MVVANFSKSNKFDYTTFIKSVSYKDLFITPYFNSMETQYASKGHFSK